METSAEGRKALIREEGSRTKAYQDSRGIWTIGVGHTAAAGGLAPKPGMVISDAQVDAQLAQDLKVFEEVANRLITAPVNQNQFDAVMLLMFNIGPGAFATSTVLRKLNAKDYAGAADAFLLFKKAGKDPDRLLPRRKRERELFLTPTKEKKSWISSKVGGLFSTMWQSPPSSSSFRD